MRETFFHFLRRFLNVTANILPRQARDKHGELKHKCMFLAGDRLKCASSALARKSADMVRREIASFFAIPFYSAKNESILPRQARDKQKKALTKEIYARVADERADLLPQQRRQADRCEKRFFAPFYTKKDHFTKTGLGQT